MHKSNCLFKTNDARMGVLFFPNNACNVFAIFQ